MKANSNPGLAILSHSKESQAAGSAASGQDDITLSSWPGA